MIEVRLPWPDRLLHPNARTHWAEKARATKSARQAAAWLSLAAIHGCSEWHKSQLRKLSIVFYPPDNRRRDLDGMIASHKAAQDGIADALGIDDSKFEISYRIGDPVKGGAVLVTISEAK